MWTLGSIAFSSPVVLFGLLALPGLWFLIRALPPQAKRMIFPPMVLLANLGKSEPPAARTPPWLLALRFLLAACLLLALSGPVLNPIKTDAGDGPMLIIVDNGWEAASRWPARITLLHTILERAARNDRPVLFLPTAPPVGGWPKSESGQDDGDDVLSLQSARALQSSLAGFTPRPWSPDHSVSAKRLAAYEQSFSSAVWISDGLEHKGSKALESEIARASKSLDVFTDNTLTPPLALLPVEHRSSGYHLTLQRPANKHVASHKLEALAANGRILGEVVAQFSSDSDTASATIALPRGIRRQVTRIHIAGEQSAGAVALLDARSGHPLVGVSAGNISPTVQPLKSPLFYLNRALEPHAEIIDGTPIELLDDNPQVLILADVGHLQPQAEHRVNDWVQKGGLLIRFAGPRMASGTDSLVPVRLRTGDRAVGGALSWEKPQPLGPFNPDGPFAGLAHSDTVTVSRQILAVPDMDLGDKSWARLADGTPLVTAARKGDGWIVLFHTTANADWSSLVLSGLFVDMLERLLHLALMPQGSDLPGDGPDRLAPQAMLDAFGHLVPPREDIPSIRADMFSRTVAGAANPPGLYGTQSMVFALGLSGPQGPIDKNFKFQQASRIATQINGKNVAERPLAPPLFWIVVLLLLADMTASLVMRGLIPVPRFGRTPMLIPLFFILGAFAFIPQGLAQNGKTLIDDAFAENATTATRIAYVRTGDAAIDARSHAALYGLGRVLDLRTAVTLGDPIAIDPARDPLALFPLVYWPVPRDAEALSPEALVNLATFLQSGGIVLMDTGVDDEAGSSLGIENPAARQALQTVIGHLDLPPLVMVNQDHVLARSFYLLDEFPGRLTGRAVWATESSTGEEPRVSPILIGSNDWASAWAIDEFDHFLVPDLSGGIRQRELSFRFGINLAMYALTGTYKADQLHLPALIERLGE